MWASILHTLISEWLHHGLSWTLAIKYLHHLYPGMPSTWYGHYLHYMINHHIGPRNW